jgi:hypothetical protein
MVVTPGKKGSSHEIAQDKPQLVIDEVEKTVAADR